MAFRLPHRVALLVLAAVVLSFSACKKETEIELKEVDKVYSWQDDRHLYGLSKVVLGLGRDASALYLQTPNFLGKLLPGAGRSAGRYFTSVGSLPADVNMRIPIVGDMYAWPAADTAIIITPMAEAGNLEYSAKIHLLKLDPQATTYKSTLAESSMGESRFAALSPNHYLLFSYRRTATAPTDPALRLVLAHITPNAAQRLQVQSQQVINFPTSNFPTLSFISQITAIDDYFLVGIETGTTNNPGIYKVQQDGTIRRVSSQTSVTAFYKWQGKVYAQTLGDNLLVSADNGETWTTYANTPAALHASGFRLIGDSLVGYLRPFNQLYSLRWNGGTGRIRELKNDGLGEAAITGIEQLGDTVYVGTTSGLFKRPAKVFFESK